MRRHFAIRITLLSLSLAGCGSDHPGEYFYAHVPMGAGFVQRCGQDPKWCDGELLNLLELDGCGPAVPPGAPMGAVVSAYIRSHRDTQDRPYTEAARLALYARWPCRNAPE